MQLVTTYRGQKRRQGTPNRAAPERKHAARTAMANTQVRTCIGCRTSASRNDLVRMVASSDGSEIVFDLSGGAFGRGAWSHPTESCLRRAVKVLRHGGDKGGPSLSPDEGLEQLLSKLEEAVTRRAKGLVVAAYRAGRIALGGDASKEEFLASRARLVVLATDARAAKNDQWVESAVANGLAIGWSTKAELGALVGRDELAIFVVTDEGLARSLRNVLVLRTPVTSRLAGASLAVARSMVATTATGSHGLEDSEDG